MNTLARENLEEKHNGQLESQTGCTGVVDIGVGDYVTEKDSIVSLVKRPAAKMLFLIAHVLLRREMDIFIWGLIDKLLVS